MHMIPRAQADRWLLLAAAFVLGNALWIGAQQPPAPAWRWGLAALMLAWALAAALLRATCRAQPFAPPPALLPLALTLSGWGLLAIWQIRPYFALRQGAWLLLAAALASLTCQTPRLYHLLARHSLRLLGAGLVLLTLTLPLGVNPSGAGPRLWLGCCGFYLQPSEPFKLLLVVAMAAEGDRHARRLALATLLAAALLSVQNDFGAAGLLLVLYAATRAWLFREIWPAAALGALAVPAAFAANRWLPIARVRLEAWLNPWQAPQAHGYQIIQALLALHRGQWWGAGPRLPVTVPLAHSDFVFAAIAQIWGVGASLLLLALLAALPLLAFRQAQRAPAGFPQRLALGLGIAFAAQTLIIVGGNVRLLPLTGMALPLVAYGGSALVSHFLALALLLALPATRTASAPALARHLAQATVAAFLIAASATIYWGFLWKPLLP